MEREEYNRLIEEMDLLKERLARKDQEIENLKKTRLFQGTIFDGIGEEIMVLDRDYTLLSP